MIINNFKGGRSIHDLFSFRQKITTTLGEEQLALIWVEHPICLFSDFNYFKGTVLDKISGLNHTDVSKISSTLKTNAFFLNYIEILYFGSPISFGNVIYTFTKPESYYDTLEKEVMMEFTSDYYKEICIGSKPFTMLLLAAIFKLLFKYSKFDERKYKSTPASQKDIDKIKEQLEGKSELSQQIQFMNTQESNKTNQSAEEIRANIKTAKEEFKRSKEFFDMMDAGKTNSQRVFNETLSTMQALNIKTFNSNHFKRFAFYIKKWAHNKKQGHTIKSHSEPLLHAEDFEEILNPEMLQFPAFIEDIMVKSTTTSVNYDVYMDISGSTAGNILNMEKRAILEFFKQKEVRNSYVFDTCIYRVDKIELLKHQDEGGTDIDVVIKQVVHHAFPSIIITDACDTMTLYSKYAMFMIFGEFMPSRFHDESRKFLRNQQIMYYKNDKFNFPPRDLG